MREFARIAPNLTRLAAGIAPALRRAIRDSRPLRYGWPAAALVGIDGVARRLPFRSFRASQLAEYGARALLMVALWGGIGALLRVAAQYARQRRFLALLVLAPVPVFSTLLLTAVAAGHLAFYDVNHFFVGPEMLRDVWSLRGVIASYALDLPGLTVCAVAVVLLLSSALAHQAWRHSREPLPHTLGVIGLGLFLVCSVVLLSALRPVHDEALLTFGSPDSDALYLLCEAAGPPPNTRAMPHGASRRDPIPVPRLERPPGVRNVLVILTESVRADAMCSDPHACADQYIDPVAPERIALSQLRTQAPGTFTTCMVLWTGLEPDSQFPDTHRAPFLWEVARAAGYQTLYVSAQSSAFFRFGQYIAVAGIDDLVTARELQPGHSQTVGADDEKAMAAMLEHLARARTPWYGVLHLSNTHALYRTDPSLQPFQPSGLDTSDLVGLKNRYLNAIALQRRSLGVFLARLRALRGWDDTLVLFLSDHGEPLGDHGEIFHRDSLFESSMRVPGWVLAGKRVLSPEQMAALKANRDRFLYTRDIHATILDALGVWEERSKIPYSGWRVGRSLLRPMAATEPIAVFANVSGVWDFATPHYGVEQGERKLISGPHGPFRCYDLRLDPGEEHAADAAACGAELLDFARQRFPRQAH